MNFSELLDRLREYTGPWWFVTSNVSIVWGWIMLYALTHLGLYLLASHRGVSGARAAWFPVGTQVVLWKLSDQYRSRLPGQKRYSHVPVVVMEVLYLVLSVLAAAWFAFLLFVMMFIGLKAVAMGLLNGIIMAFGGLEAMEHLLDVEGVTKSAMQDPKTMMLWQVAAALMLLHTVITALRMWLHSRSLLDVYRSCRKKAAVPWLVFGIFFPVLKPLFLFLCANQAMKEDVSL